MQQAISIAKRKTGRGASRKGCSVCFTGCKFFPGSLSPPPLAAKPTRQLPPAGPALGTSQVEQLIQSTGSAMSPHRHGDLVLPAATAGWELLPQFPQDRHVGAQAMLQRWGSQWRYPTEEAQTSCQKPRSSFPAILEARVWHEPLKEATAPQGKQRRLLGQPLRPPPRVSLQTALAQGTLGTKPSRSQNPSEDPFRATNPAWCWGTLDVAAPSAPSPVPFVHWVRGRADAGESSGKVGMGRRGRIEGACTHSPAGRSARAAQHRGLEAAESRLVPCPAPAQGRLPPRSLLAAPPRTTGTEVPLSSGSRGRGGLARPGSHRHFSGRNSQNRSLQVAKPC